MTKRCHSPPKNRSLEQAIALCVEAQALAVLAEEFEVRTAVVINEENILTVVAALNNVVRLTRDCPSLLTNFFFRRGARGARGRVASRTQRVSPASVEPPAPAAAIGF